MGTVVSQGRCEDLFLLYQAFTFQSWVCWTCLFLLSVDGTGIPYGEWGVTSGVLRRGGEGHVHLVVCCRSLAQVVASQGMQNLSS